MDNLPNIQKILLLNAGLDVGYMLGGLYLTERSKNTEKNPERIKSAKIEPTVIQKAASSICEEGSMGHVKEWLSYVMGREVQPFKGTFLGYVAMKVQDFGHFASLYNYYS